MHLPEPLASAPWPPGLPTPVAAIPAEGGFVARVWLGELADGTPVAVKVTPYPADAEADGLAALASAGVPAPEVLGHVAGTLVMRRVSGPADWPSLGRAVAGMHAVTHDRFGWHRDNRMGRFVQPNSWSTSWPEFFVANRVRVHLSDPRVPAELALRLQRACDGPLREALDPAPRPSLTHGDLWRGNIIEGRWVVDPEVSFADRELDLGNLLTSRDPLPEAFWGAYREFLPLPEGYQRRIRPLGLHHALLGVRHFGDRAVPRLAALLTELGW